MLHFLICDRDACFCENLTQFIRKFCQNRKVKITCDVYHTGDEIIALGEKLTSYHVIFLDASTEAENSIKLGNRLRNMAPELLVVLMSDQVAYAPDGYKIGAVRYILKDEKRLKSSIEECLTFLLQKLQEEHGGYLVISDKRLRVSTDKILYVESRAHRITYHLIESKGSRQEYTIYGKLDDAEKELYEFGFCRVHQSYLVNMKYVQEVRRYDAVLSDGREIQISKRRYKEVREQFLI